MIQRTYQWNGADRLVGVNIPGSSTTGSYKYNVDGKRVQQTANGTVTNYLWDEFSRYGDVALETNSTGTVLTSYVLGTGELIGQKKNTGTLSYYLFDGQGSVRDLTSTTGSVTESYTYDTFGKLTSGQSAPASSYLYTGQQYDSLSELYSLRARYYEPKQGRFLSQDTWPISFNNPVELNRYAYTANNPVNASDPSGYSFIDVLFLRFYIRATAFAAAHPIAAGVINVLLSLFIPFEVLGVPSPPTGGVGQAIRELGRVRLLANLVPVWVRNNRFGNGFRDWVGRFLSGAEEEISFLNGTRVAYGTPGSRRVDYVWRENKSVSIYNWLSQIKSKTAPRTELPAG